MRKVKLHSDVRETVSDNQNIENQISTSSDQLQVYANLEKKILDKIQGMEIHIDQTISKKLAENQKNIDEKIKQVSESYADSVNRSSQLLNRLWTSGKLCERQKNEELVQQKEREARAQNIVIHGLPEEADTQEGNIEADINRGRIQKKNDSGTNALACGSGHIWDGKQAVSLHKCGSGLGSFEPTMGCSRKLQAKECKFEVTSVATG